MITSRKCPTCENPFKDHTDAQIYTCRQAEELRYYSEVQAQKLYRRGMVSAKFGKQTFDTWEQLTNLEAIYCHDIDRWVNGLNVSMYIHGGCGTGKTYAGRCILYQAMQQRQSVAEITAYNMLKMSQKFDHYEIVKKYERVKFLLLDDIDKPNWDEKGLSFLWQLFNARADNGCRTIITSNVAPDNLRTIFAESTGGNESKIEATLQRLHPISIIEMSGKSRRGE